MKNVKKNMSVEVLDDGRFFRQCNIIDRLMAELHRRRVKMVYRKKDGTLRIAVGTLCPAFIPQEYLPQGKGVERPYLVNYWDLQKGGWRAFQKSRFEYFEEEADIDEQMLSDFEEVL